MTAAQARSPGGRVACWVLTHRARSPRGSPASPARLKVGHRFPPPATASAVPAGRVGKKRGALDFGVFKGAVRTRAPERRLQRPLSCDSLSAQAPARPVATFSCQLSPAGASAVRCTPDGFVEGGRVTGKQSQPLWGCYPAAPPAYRPAHAARDGARRSLPVRVSLTMRFCGLEQRP